MAKAVRVVERYTKPRPSWLLRRVLAIPPLMYRIGLAEQAGLRLMVLTTRGRRSGRPRRVGLNYARDGETVYVLSGYQRSDWYRNLLADPRVGVEIGEERWVGEARPVTDPKERARGLARLRALAAQQGPPAALRPMFAWLGLDYEAEIRRMDEPGFDMPMVAIAHSAGAVMKAA